METVLHFQPVIEVSDEDFYAFCQLNRDMCIERNAQGDVIVMPPAGGETSQRNAEITMQLRFWAKRDGTGASFDFFRWVSVAQWGGAVARCRVD